MIRILLALAIAAPVAATTVFAQDALPDEAVREDTDAIVDTEGGNIDPPAAADMPLEVEAIEEGNTLATGDAEDPAETTETDTNRVQPAD